MNEVQLQITDSCKTLITQKIQSFIYSLCELNEKHTMKHVRVVISEQDRQHLQNERENASWMTIYKLVIITHDVASGIGNTGRMNLIRSVNDTF